MATILVNGERKTLSAAKAKALAAEIADDGSQSVPAEVKKVLLVRALRAAGKWNDVRDAIAAAPEDIQEDWEFADPIPRADPMVVALASGVGLSDADLDAVFIAADELRRS